jgi:hypothetical protein
MASLSSVAAYIAEALEKNSRLVITLAAPQMMRHIFNLISLSIELIDLVVHSFASGLIWA